MQVRFTRVFTNGTIAIGSAVAAYGQAVRLSTVDAGVCRRMMRLLDTLVPRRLLCLVWGISDQGFVLFLGDERGLRVKSSW
ncbi:hypothetical protein BU23DRAFT_550970 [Bimuria novae-zelandiae CBS 107.79]|uniref:Uncharacterized protein n=1 Tax=Bimuria novae-zelandiae CBS 107.79 TaxID=1447943 RepID=A0A6A5VIH9_9PLEO|nr:hypothetical protein BU23DRAFT_550970 [Bimuria novae-zelandiae CBS 107.79]